MAVGQNRVPKESFLVKGKLPKIVAKAVLKTEKLEPPTMGQVRSLFTGGLLRRQPPSCQVCTEQVLHSEGGRVTMSHAWPKLTTVVCLHPLDISSDH